MWCEILFCVFGKKKATCFLCRRSKDSLMRENLTKEKGILGWVLQSC